MPKRRKSKFKKRKAKLNTENKENLNDTISNDIKNGDCDTQFTTPIPRTRLSWYETPKVTPLRNRFHRYTENIQESPKSTNVSRRFCYENIDWNRKSNNSSSKFYTCDEKFENTTEKKCFLSNNETPKCSKTNKYDIEIPRSFKRKNINKHSWSQINVNPFLKNRDHNFKENNCEDSPLSPYTFQNRYSSTPIAQITKKTTENNAEYNFDDNLITSPETPTFNKNINLNNSYTTEKVLSKDNNMRKLKLQKLNTPKHIKSLLVNSFDKILSPKLENSFNVSKKDFPDGVDVSEIKFGMFLERLKRCYKIASNWFVRIWDYCLGLGDHLKRGTVSVERDVTQPIQIVCDQCNKYEEQIAQLSKRMEEFVKVEEINEMKQQLDKFSDLQSQLETLKEQLNKKTAPFVPCSLPPPPPPLPPPILPFLETKTTFKLPKKSNNGSGVKSPGRHGQRPVISVDDILKVQLKKASARPFKPTPISLSRNVQPTISLDMLKTVRLKPISRSTNFKNPTENESIDLMSSPNSRLCTLLKNEISSTKIKRLRRIGGYSCDSVYKRKLLLESREREY